MIKIVTFAALLLSVCALAETKPKYGPLGHAKATTLWASHGYFQTAKHPAPDFWALIPYYVPQQNEKSCSVASVSMVVNAARVGVALTADDKLALQSELLKKVQVGVWDKCVGPVGRGIKDLEQLRTFLKESLEAYGVKVASIEVMHVEKSETSKKQVHEALVQNEKSSQDFIVANFMQNAFTDDAEVGHIAPVAAYDAEKKRVLILDPDREYYEPYWVSESDFIAGMATFDEGAGKNRGLLWVKLGK